ncbi:MAG: asparagine synthetase B family protein [Alphaproteobacteria bacterium]
MTSNVRDLQRDPSGDKAGLLNETGSPLSEVSEPGGGQWSVVSSPWSHSAPPPTPYLALGPESFADGCQVEGIRVFVEGDIQIGGGPLLNSNGPARRQVVEALLDHYRRGGDAFVEELHGGFRLALWDAENQKLLLVVDPFGTRSLYYCSLGGTLAFAPKLSYIVSAVPSVSRDIDPNVVYFFLNHSFIPAPYTIYRNIKRLEPGQCLAWQDGSSTFRQYWDIHYDEDPTIPADEAAELIYSSVERSVRSLLEAHNSCAENIGAFLSGGTDSSTLVGLMSQLGRGRVKSFSVGFAEERYNEIHYARIAAARFNADARERFVSADDALAAVPVLAAHFDEPFANASAIPTYFCLVTAKDAGMNVMFAGDGGDELFAGNERYLAEKRFLPYDALPRPLQLVSKHVATLFPAIYPLAKMRRYIERASQPNPDRFFHYQLYFQQQNGEFLTDDFTATLDHEFPLEMPRRHYEQVSAVAPLNRLLYMDLKMCIADNDLFKVNRMAEASGVKVCYPYLDRNLADLTGRIPAALKLKGLQKRYIFKKAFGNLLPEEILHKKKHGFGLPVARWLRSHAGFRELAHSLLLDAKPLQRGYFNRKGLETLVDKHENEPSDYYGAFIWNLMMLELWHQKYCDK